MGKLLSAKFALLFPLAHESQGGVGRVCFGLETGLEMLVSASCVEVHAGPLMAERGERSGARALIAEGCMVGGN